MDKRRFQSFEGLLLPKKSQPLGSCRLLKGRSLKKMEKKAARNKPNTILNIFLIYF